MDEKQVLNVPCSFGTVGFGKDTARIGIKVAREQLGLERADELLCGMRLTGKLTADKTDPDQMQLPGMEGTHESVCGSFDVKSISLKPDEIGFGATFSVATVDQHALIALRSRTGRIVITGAEELPDDDRESDVDDHEDVGPRPKPLKGQKTISHLGAAEKLGDPGADRPLMDLVPLGLTAAKVKLVVAAVGGETIGHLETAMRKNEWWHRDIKGFGETWVTKLQDAHIAFRQRYPMPDETSLADYEDGYSEGVEDFNVDPEMSNPHPDGTWDAKGWAKGFADAKAGKVDVDGTGGDEDEETDVDEEDLDDIDELETE